MVWISRIHANIYQNSLFHRLSCDNRSPCRSHGWCRASLERSTYIWIASLLLIAVCALWTPVPDVAWDVDGPWRWPLHLIQISGGWLTICSAATLDVRELAGVADPVGERLPAVDGNSNRDTGPPPSTVGEFRTGGPDGWVRHPIYAGWFLSVFGVVPMTMTRLTFAVVSGLYVLIAIPPRGTFDASGTRRRLSARRSAGAMAVVPGVY